MPNTPVKWSAALNMYVYEGEHDKCTVYHGFRRYHKLEPVHYCHVLAIVLVEGNQHELFLVENTLDRKYVFEQYLSKTHGAGMAAVKYIEINDKE